MPRFLGNSIVVFVALLVVIAPATVVFAHAGYERSEPAADSAVSEMPVQIRIWFTQELFRRAGENGIEVYGPDGRRVDLEDAAIDDDDRTLMSIGLQSDLPAGLYIVRWYTLSAEDGHDGEGEFTITVGEPAAVDTTQPLPSTLESDAPSTPVVEEDVEPTNSAAGSGPLATATPTPVAVATATSPATGLPSTLPCLGSSILALFAVGAVWGRRRQSISGRADS